MRTSLSQDVGLTIACWIEGGGSLVLSFTMPPDQLMRQKMVRKLLDATLQGGGTLHLLVQCTAHTTGLERCHT